MNGLSGFALAGYLNDLEREKKRAYGAVDTLNRESAASDQYQGAKSRTQDWLSSLSPEDLAKLNPEVKNIPSNFEGVGDVSGFESTKRANELGLTSQFAGVDGIEEYIKSLGKQKEEKRYNEESAAIEDATTGIQRQKKFADLNALEDMVGMKKGDYGLKSNREVAVGSGLPKFSGSDRGKEFMETYVEKPEENVYKSLPKEKSTDPNELQFGNRAGLVSWFNKPEKVQETLEQLSAFKDKFNMNEDVYNMWVKKAQEGESYDAREYMTNEMESKLKNKYSIEKEYGLIDPRKMTAGATTEARGEADAFTPKFVAERKKEWEKTLSGYNEGYQQFALGKAAPDDATGDVALINALEKVRETDSAVMYGDFEKWKKATNFWQSLEQNGLVDAATSKLKARLPNETREVIKTLLNDMYSNRKSILASARKSAMDAAIEDYGWDEKKANRTYRMPELGYGQGYDEKSTQPKPIVTEPTNNSKPVEPSKNDALEKLKKAAASGNQKAQSALKKAGIAWQ
jgi:hypothetical protein